MLTTYTDITITGVKLDIFVKQHNSGRTCKIYPLATNFNEMEANWTTRKNEIYMLGNPFYYYKWSDEGASGAENGFTYWEGALHHLPEPAHGILSFEGDNVANPFNHESFLDYIGFRYDIVYSWIQAQTGGSLNFPWLTRDPFSIICHAENEYDCLCTPIEGISMGPDTTNDEMVHYWSEEISVFYTPSSSSSAPEQEEIDATKADSPQAKQVPKAWALKHQFGLKKKPFDFDVVREWESGDIQLSKRRVSKFQHLDLNIAQGEATQYVKEQLQLPDAELSACCGVFRESTSEPAEIVAYHLIFTHSHKSLPIAGDGIGVLVTNDGVMNVTGIWHDFVSSSVQIDNKTTTAGNIDFEKAKNAYRKRWPDKQLPEVKGTRQVYYIGDMGKKDTQIVRVAREVTFDDGNIVLSDTETGDIIDHIKDTANRRGKLIHEKIRKRR